MQKEIDKQHKHLAREARDHVKDALVKRLVLSDLAGLNIEENTAKDQLGSNLIY